MNKKCFFTLSFVFLTCFWASAELYINEVNSAGKWIEIYNSGNTTVDVGGYTVIRYNNDHSDNTATIPEGTTIAAERFLVLFQTGVGAPVEGAIECLPYGISTDKFWYAILKDKSGKIADETFDVGFPQMVKVIEGQSWARETDGGLDIVALTPTPGKSNTSAPLEPSELKIYINEVNSTGKWMEIYNDEDEPVDLGGFTIARFNNDNAIAQNPIPAGTIIAAKGFIVLYQGEAVLSPVDGAIDCLTFGISTDKFWYIVLKDKVGRLVDNTFNIDNPQTVTVSSGQSWAREIDGNATIKALEPTPGKPNTTIAEPSDLKIFINEVNSTGKWIELYNDEENAVNVGRFTVTRNNNDGSVNIAIIPENTTIAAKGFLVLFQGGTVTAPSLGAIDCLPFGISSDKFKSVLLKDDEGRFVDRTFDIGNHQTVTVTEGQSWARETDGAEAIVALEPTPGKSNTFVYEASDLKIYVNEVNSNGKWIELYNDEEEEVDLSGYSVVRYNNDNITPAIAFIPNGTTLESKGFLVLYQGSVASAPVEGAIDCLPFGISTDKFMNVILIDALDRLVDTTFNIGNPQSVLVSDGQSWAREKDGADDIIALMPTPGLTNYDLTPNSVINGHNPASVYAGILFLPDHTSDVYLYRMDGRLVLRRSGQVLSIHLDALPQGIYVARMNISGQSVVQKIVLTGY